jgi:ABC-type uncharacterized transport system permease subunit
MDPSFLTDRVAIAGGTVFYAAGLLYGSWSLFYRRRYSRIASYALVFAGWAVQTYGLYLRGLATHSCPLGNKFEILQFTVWSCSLLYLAVGAAFRTSVLGFFCAAAATAISSVALAVPAWDSELRVHYFGANPWVELHAALAVFSYGVLTLLALTSWMHLLQLRHLQRKTRSGLYAFLPSIVELDHMNVRLLFVGTALLSIAVGMGGLRHLADPGSVKLPHLAVSAAVWLAYAAVLTQRLRQRLVARGFSTACLALLVVLLASLWPVTGSRRPLPAAPDAAPADRSP